MKTSRVPLTALAALVTLTLAGMSASALAATTPIQTDIGMHNDDNNCTLSVSPPENGVSFSALMSVENHISTIEAVESGERFIDVKLTGNGPCTLTSAKVTQTFSVPALPGTRVRWRGVPTSNGGVIPVFVFMTRVLGYTSSGMESASNVEVVAKTTTGSKGNYKFTESTDPKFEEGTYYNSNGKNDTNYQSPYGTAGQRPNFLMLASSYVDYGGPLAYTGNPITSTYTQFENPRIVASNTQDNLRAIRVGVGAMISDTPYASADNLPDPDVVYDSESLKFTSTITVTPL
ncbi:MULTISPECIES: hypothetical protein [Enterobacter]|uniref:hypothetical protein n=1 Tax=Enterobacter TaxID=547 RepID=UPI001E353FEF|nr:MULTISPECIES: hypothetical protein [Enterobacter]MCE1613504.1 hypothetical protein [Enterobacter ludwigii]MCE1626805.1 hypothetical protein [Enterobacter ludwigii]GLH27225.1 hypothetical protein ENT52713_46210 [Enterobacter sp. 200527-13]